MAQWNVDEAYRILKKDPVLKKIINTTGAIPAGKERDVYFSLLNSITSQQLSLKAGETIFGRFLDLFPGRVPEPSKLAKMNIEKLRASGLSYAKAQYLKNIAAYSISHGLENKILRKMNDEELIEYLTAIKGVGRWSAEMILMFTLNRPDVLPVDDLGIRQEMQRLYNLDGDKKILTASMTSTAEKWRPYRTLACRHLWLHRDMQKTK